MMSVSNTVSNTLCDNVSDYLCVSGPQIYEKGEYSFSRLGSFGVMLFELLTSRAPFYGADHDELYMSDGRDTPPYPSRSKLSQKNLLVKVCISVYVRDSVLLTELGVYTVPLTGFQTYIARCQ